ncbi:3-hydroxyisobutyrate dehydrogenase, mitochondrial [Nymphon striatum]|nr:3-hydroxyisobutyrate dehydrogenase, mitochondrial [Nymphon striatum]
MDVSLMESFQYALSSVNAAKAGTLTFMVGGKESEFGAVKELLQCMGKNIVYCGNVGNGQAAKICNNMLLGISMIGTAETMNLGMRLGLDPKLLASVLNTSSGRCWSSELYNPVPGVLNNVPSSNDYSGGFGTALMAKDLGLAQNSATRTTTSTPMGSLAHQFSLFAIRDNDQRGSSNSVENRKLQIYPISDILMSRLASICYLLPMPMKEVLFEVSLSERIRGQEEKKVVYSNINVTS